MAIPPLLLIVEGGGLFRGRLDDLHDFFGRVRQDTELDVITAPFIEDVDYKEL